MAPCGAEIANHGPLHLLGEDGAEFMAIFTHGELESFASIVEEVSDACRCLGRGVRAARRVFEEATNAGISEITLRRAKLGRA